MKSEAERIESLRKICMKLPGVTEKLSWGQPNFRVGEKMFAGYGTGHGGPHLVFKVADRSALSDSRFKPVSSVGAWRGYEDWLIYFFDDQQKDDWKSLAHLVEVSWELIFGKLSKKKQDAILGPPAESPARSKKKKTAKARK